MRKNLLAIIGSLVLASVGAVSSILWANNTDISKLKEYKQGHFTQHSEIKIQLDEIRSDQKVIIDHLLNRKGE